MHNHTLEPLSTLAGGLVLLAAAMLPLQAAAACRAGEAPNTTRNEFRRSQAVVMGHVVQTVNHAAPNTPARIAFTDYTFKVERQLKGKRARTLLVRSTEEARFPMNEQRQYMLFLKQGSDNKWYVNSCGNSALMARKVPRPPKA